MSDNFLQGRESGTSEVLHWTDRLKPEDVNAGPLPVSDILNASLYYPASGFDGSVIKECNTRSRRLGIRSFVYCDYAVGEEAFLSSQDDFLGYHVLAGRPVQKGEMAPSGWRPVIPPGVDMERYVRYRDVWKPFAHWMVYERDADRTEEHGPARFSLLYVGGEGAATFQALYWSNRKSPSAIAIIRPGTGWGFNWTDFRNPDRPFAWVVMNNPVEVPEWAFCVEEDFKWPGYSKQELVPLAGDKRPEWLTLWRKTP